MILADVHLLVDAHREDAESRAACRAWLEGVVNTDQAYGMSGLALSGFVRVVTHPRVLREPSPIAAALAFADQLLGLPPWVPVRPGPRHRPIFARLARRPVARHQRLDVHVIGHRKPRPHDSAPRMPAMDINAPEVNSSPGKGISRASPGAASRPAGAWAGTAGWSSARRPGSTASAA